MTPAQRTLLAQELKRQGKTILIACLTELAETSPDAWRILENRLDLAPRTVGDLVARANSAIAHATDFDERQINHNFDYDWAAYEQVESYFRQFVKMGQLETAMELAEELMTDGSYQVEMSDEGLMWDEIKSCLDVVHNAVTASSIPAEKILLWAARLKVADRVGLYDPPDILWKKSYPTEVWDRVADGLIRKLAPGKAQDPPISERRREAILRQAEHALTKAGRSSEIAVLRNSAKQSSSARRKRPARRTR